MGNENLLKCVKLATTETKLQDMSIKNSSASVDISHWIYKACYANPELFYHKGNDQEFYKVIIDFIDHYVGMLKHYNVRLTFVFNGLKLPAKRRLLDSREMKRNEARKMVEKFLAENNQIEARKYMLNCIEIKFNIIREVIAYCKYERINYIIAPYEANAQLAHYNRVNLCEFTITNDTDLIMYGCEKIIYNLSTTGTCLLYEKSKLGKCFGPREDQVEFEKFRRMCLLSGCCDYLKNFPQVGFQRAKRFFLMVAHQTNISLILPKLPSYLKSCKLGKMTQEYIDGFIIAENIFKYHIIFAPIEQKLKPLEPYQEYKTFDDYPMAGKIFCNVQATDLIQGEIDLDEMDQDFDLVEADETDDETDRVLVEINNNTTENIYGYSQFMLSQ